MPTCQINFQIHKKQEYKWFLKIYEWHKSTANVQNQILAITIYLFQEDNISCMPTLC